MYRKQLFTMALVFTLVGCGRIDPSTIAHDPIDQDQDSVIPTTGGAAVSSDGLFSIVLGPFVFDQTVTMTIEKLEAPLAEPEAHLLGTYRVTFSPEEAVLSPNANFRVQFKVDSEVLDEVGVENMRVAIRPHESEAALDAYEFENNANFDANKAVVWTSTATLGEFGLLDRTQANPNACACDTDDSCDETCECDPDCNLDDPADATCPTDPATTDDPADPTDDVGPLECDETQWACADGEQCVAISDYCNGLPQCNDGSDETDVGCSGGTGTGGPSPDTFEPDSQFSEATPYVVGEPQQHTMPLGDEDYILFTLEERRDVTIETSGGSGDTELYLYTENYSELAMDDQGGVNSFSKITTVLEAGNYFARVRAGGWSPAAIYNYTFTITTMEPLAPAPQNLVGTLNSQDVVLTWDAIEGAGTDETGTNETGGYVIHYGTVSGGPYDSSFSEANEGPSPISTTENTITLTGLAQNSTFYFVVSAVDDAGVESYPSNEVSATIPLLADTYEADDSFETANTIEPGVAQEHSIHVAGDFDYLVFELTAWKNNITVGTSGPSGGDTRVYLFDENFTELGDDDMSGDGFYSLLSINELAAGTYYIRAQLYFSWNTWGQYFVELNVEEIAPPSTTPDAFEDDNTVETAGELLASSPQTRSIHQNGDIDYVAFSVPSKADVTLATSGSAGGDTILRIFNPAGEEIAADATVGEFSSITLSELAAGDYHASVASQTLPEMIESYSLSLEILAYPAAPIDVTATAGPDSIVVSWPAVVPATDYVIYYQYSNEAPFETVVANEGGSPLSTQELSFTLTGLPTDAPTHLCVSALNGTAESACSELVSATPTEVVDPTDTTDPTDAGTTTDPADATDATDPTDATDATDPTDATDATDPTDPTDAGAGDGGS